MDMLTDNLRSVRPEDIEPRFDWERHLPVLGTMAVDFEERVNYRRLHEYRIARARRALEASELGALLVFDVNNIRYLTSTKIGEWERDKLSRWVLLVHAAEGNGPSIFAVARFESVCHTNIRKLPTQCRGMPATRT